VGKSSNREKKRKRNLSKSVKKKPTGNSDPATSGEAQRQKLKYSSQKKTGKGSGEKGLGVGEPEVNWRAWSTREGDRNRKCLYHVSEDTVCSVYNHKEEKLKRPGKKESRL